MLIDHDQIPMIDIIKFKAFDWVSFLGLVMKKSLLNSFFPHLIDLSDSFSRGVLRAIASVKSDDESTYYGAMLVEFRY